MWNWIGGKGAQQSKDAPKKAILELRTQLDMLQRREKHLETQIAQQQTIAKANAGKNKETAIRALKRKKQHETVLTQTANQINILEDQIYSIESANINRETLQAMQNAGKAMAAIHGNMTVEKVDDIMEEIRNQKDIAEEVNNALVNGPVSSEAVDEDELAKELEDMEQEKLDEEMLKGGSVPVLPTGPLAEPSIKTQAVAEDDEEEELRKLQAEMAM